MKRLLGIFVFIFLASFIFTKSIFAQDTSTYPMRVNSDVPKNLHTYTQTVVLELLSAFSCQLSGIDPLNPAGQCLGADPVTGKIGFVKSQGGLLGFFSGSIDGMYKIPISSGDYISYLSSNFGIVKKANAQLVLGPGGPTSGYNGLAWMQTLWINIRNIVYIFFVLVFVFVGIAVMFRIKIDPRTVMSIQGALPKIIIGLLLVTFSYAIAGFLVDMMRVSLYLTYNTLAPSHPVGLAPADIQGANVFEAVGNIPPSYGLGGIASDATGGIVTAVKDAIGLSTKPPTSLCFTCVPTINGVLTSIRTAMGSLFDSIFSVPILGGIIHFLIDIFLVPFRAIPLLVIAFTDTSYAAYFIHIVSSLTATYGFLQLVQMDSPSADASVIAGTSPGVTVGSGVGVDPGFFFSGIIAFAAAINIFAVTELLLREALPNLIAFFLILGILITALFRVWFALFKCFLYIILYVIFAPFWIAFGLIPGIEAAGFSPWVRGLISNLLAFPVTYALILIAKWFYDIPDTCGGFVPPLIGQSCNGKGFASLFVVGILLAIPEVINMVKTALKAPQGKLGSSIAAGVAGGTAFAMATPRAGWGMMWGADRMGKAKPLTAFAQRYAGNWVGHLAGVSSAQNTPQQAAFRSTRAYRNASTIGRGVGRLFGRRSAAPTPPPTSTPTPPTNPADEPGDET